MKSMSNRLKRLEKNLTVTQRVCLVGTMGHISNYGSNCILCGKKSDGRIWDGDSYTKTPCKNALTESELQEFLNDKVGYFDYLDIYENDPYSGYEIIYPVGLRGFLNFAGWNGNSDSDEEILDKQGDFRNE